MQRIAATALCIALSLAAGCGPEPQASLDDALRSYDAKRWAECLRTARDVQRQSTDPLERQQAAYLAGCAAHELSKRDEARDAFAVAARSPDPALAGRALAMQGAVAVEERRWADAAGAYEAAAAKLAGPDAERAREQARDASAKAAEARAAALPASSGAAGSPAGGGQVPPIPAPTVVPAEPDVPWTVAAGAFASETAARQRATNLAKEAKRAGLPTPRVLAVTSPGKRVWIVEIGSFADRAQAEAARKKFATPDAAVVRSRMPPPRG